MKSWHSQFTKFSQPHQLYLSDQTLFMAALHSRCGFCFTTALFLSFFISFSFYFWSLRCMSVATRKVTTWLHLHGNFRHFNGKLLAPLTSTAWTKNFILGPLSVGWCNILHRVRIFWTSTPVCMPTASVELQMNTLSAHVMCTLAPKTTLLYAERCHRKSEIFHLCQIVKN